MSRANWCVIVLAAGKGKRMKSDLPKVVHEVAGIPMIVRVCSSAKYVADLVIAVVGHKYEKVMTSLSGIDSVKFALQKDQKGTGHAVKCAVEYIDEDIENIMVLCGDTPLVRGESLKAFADGHTLSGNKVSILAMELDNPCGYGRIVTDSEKNVLKIVEQADADSEEIKIGLVNSGIYCFRKSFMVSALDKLGCNNAQGEYYLTDLIGFASRDSKKNVGFHILENRDEAMGVNSPEELVKAEAVLAGMVSGS